MSRKVVRGKDKARNYRLSAIVTDHLQHSPLLFITAITNIQNVDSILPSPLNSLFARPFPHTNILPPSLPRHSEHQHRRRRSQRILYTLNSTSSLPIPPPPTPQPRRPPRLLQPQTRSRSRRQCRRTPFTQRPPTHRRRRHLQHQSVRCSNRHRTR